MVFNLLPPLLLLLPLLALSLDTPLNDDVLGLIVFKAALQDPLGQLASWTEDADDACGFAGVRCGEGSNRVSDVVLDGFSLSGHIGKGILRLQFLRRLSLAGNNFTGSINPDLAHLGGLAAIDLSRNALSGEIPEGFFRQCGSLREVSFAMNELTGRIPESLSECFPLAKVNFSSNKLSGELPVGLWNLRGLEVLDLADNHLEGEIREGIENLYGLSAISFRKNWLSGTIPKGIGSCSMLKSVDFSENFLYGEIPDSIQRLSSCSSLSLGGNSLVGEIPEWIGKLGSLVTLDLSSNEFAGRIPVSIGNLRLLERLNLSANELRGSLPESISNCSELSELDVSWNLLSGILPQWIFRRNVRTSALESSPVGLRVLSLSVNRFSGELPSDIGAVSSLRFLNMSGNDLSGSIPTSIGELKDVLVLDLSDNRLSGIVPSEIGGASSLGDLRLQKNFLTGEIPPQLEKCSALTSLILSNNNLSGPVPAAIANLLDLRYVDLSFNQLTGNLPKELTNLSHLAAFNVSGNRLEGELPVGGFFNTISASSVAGNPSLCGSVVGRSCPNVHPKPIVLNPNSSDSGNTSSPLHHARKKTILSISALVAIGAAATIIVGVVAVTVLNIRARSSGRGGAAPPLPFADGEDPSCSPGSDQTHGKLVMFSGNAEFVSGAQALLNKECELGRGGFGLVYRAELRDGRSVAIKKLTSSLIKSGGDFEREVRNLAKIQHVNLVALEGYYWLPSLQLIIYEYIPGGTLHSRLHSNAAAPLMWRQRFEAILGVARGLAHLHRAETIHYNVKSGNVLIGRDGSAKLADAGLARLLPEIEGGILSGKVRSALGYTAPEIACRGVRITEKCDVYAFGVLLLEAVTGRRPVEYAEDDVAVLCDAVRAAVAEGRAEGCVDGRMAGEFPAEEAVPVIKLGLICASQVPSNRPEMDEVVNILDLIQCPSDGQEELRL